MRRARLLAVALLATAPAAAAFAHSWPGRPRTNPPRLSQAGPPAAWVETRQRSRWMAFSSYCWKRSAKALCVDMEPIQSRHDLGVLRASRGKLIRFHLAFRPREAHLTIYRGLAFKHSKLQPRRLMAWRLLGFGVAVLDVKAAAGTASYAIRFRPR